MASPNDFPAGEKKAFIYEIGANLVHRYGRKKFYRPQEVVIATQVSSFKDRCSPSWAMCIFCSEQGFESYHKSCGYNYELMRTIMRDHAHKNEVQRQSVAVPVSLDEVADTVDIVATIGEFIAGFFD